MNDWAWTGTFGVQLANVWSNVLSTVCVQVTKVPEGNDKKWDGGSKKCKTAVGNVTTTLFVLAWLHYTQEIHLTIHWNFKRKTVLTEFWQSVNPDTHPEQRFPRAVQVFERVGDTWFLLVHFLLLWRLARLLLSSQIPEHQGALVRDP